MSMCDKKNFFKWLLLLRPCGESREGGLAAPLPSCIFSPHYFYLQHLYVGPLHENPGSSPETHPKIELLKMLKLIYLCVTDISKTKGSQGTHTVFHYDKPKTVGGRGREDVYYYDSYFRCCIFLHM